MTASGGRWSHGCAQTLASTPTGRDLILLPHDAPTLLATAMSDPTIGAVCFRLRFDREHWLLRLYAFASRFESLFTTFGDQCSDAALKTRCRARLLGAVCAYQGKTKYFTEYIPRGVCRIR